MVILRNSKSPRNAKDEAKEKVERKIFKTWQEIIAYLNIDTVEVAASLLEVKKGQYKISLRSKTYVDVNRLAGCYGGGGHVRAAGCMLFGDLEDVLDRLSYTVSQYLE